MFNVIKIDSKFFYKTGTKQHPNKKSITIKIPRLTK